MCLGIFHFLPLKWENKYKDLHHIYIFIKTKLGSTKPARAFFKPGLPGQRGKTTKSNMTLTSLTGKSLKPTWEARWCCLCLSQCVTDKHHTGSINRLIALSRLPLRCTQLGWVVGVLFCVVKMRDKIRSISESHWYVISSTICARERHWTHNQTYPEAIPRWPHNTH